MLPTIRFFTRREDSKQSVVLALGPLTLTLSPEDGGEGTSSNFV